jgi:hypothetical protein
MALMYGRPFNGVDAMAGINFIMVMILIIVMMVTLTMRASMVLMYGRPSDDLMLWLESITRW